MQFIEQDLITFPEAAKLVPGQRHPTTIWRWATVGIKGVRLSSLKVGGTTYTSIAALQEFFDSVTAAKQLQLPSDPSG